VTTLSSHRVIAPFGAAGGEPGKTGLNYAIMPDGTRRDLKGNAGIELAAGAAFVIETPGGGGWGAPETETTSH